MGGMISGLYYGNLQPYEQDYTDNGDADLLEKSFQEGKSWLMEHLDGKEKELLSGMVQAHNKQRRLIGYEGFRSGFIIGANLIMEAFYGAREVQDEPSAE